MSEEETLNARWDRIHILEHYHFGIILMIVWLFYPRNWILGISTALFFTEWTGDRARPFGVGKDHFVSSTVVGIVLAAILAALYLLT